jgi:hypothetical protein
MAEVFRYLDATEDELMVDVVEPGKWGHRRPLEMMFSCHNTNTQQMVSVILPVEQVLKLMTTLHLELDAIRPDPEDPR